MKTIGSVVLYDSIDNMPQLRKHLFDKFLILEEGIGGSMEGLEKSFSKLDHYILAKDFDKLVMERQNMYTRYINALSLVNFKSLAFVCLVKSINGKVIDLIDESGAEEYQNEVLKSITNRELNDFVEEVKKKYLKSLGYIFQNEIAKEKS